MLENEICAAIRNKKVITFTYNRTVRYVEPHLLGYDSDDDLTLSAWQIQGTGTGWRDFHVSKLSGLSTTGQSFSGPRPGYNPQDGTIKRIVCRL